MDMRCNICGQPDGAHVDDVHGKRDVIISLKEFGIAIEEDRQPICEHCQRFLSHAGNTVSLDTPAEVEQIHVAESEFPNMRIIEIHNPLLAPSGLMFPTAAMIMKADAEQIEENEQIADAEAHTDQGEE